MENQKFLSLSCPSCGANLEVGQNERRFKCAYCGKTHLVAQVHSDKKEEARVDGSTVLSRIPCPVDGHRDEISKVSKYVQPSGIHWMPPVERVKDETRQAYAGHLLDCPSRPGPSPVPFLTGLSVVLYLVCILGFAAIGSAASLEGSDVEAGGIGFILGAIPGAALALFIDTKVLDPLEMRVGRENAERDKAWRRAKKRWDRAYYCQRHDVVFVEGGENSASPAKFREFLYMDEEGGASQ